MLTRLRCGRKQWTAVPSDLNAETVDKRRDHPGALVLRGFIVNASNLKAIVFILAVLPQFLDATRPLLAQYLTMTVTMVGVDLIVMAGYTGLATRVLCLLRQPGQQRLLNRIFGGLFAAALLGTLRQAAH